MSTDPNARLEDADFLRTVEDALPAYLQRRRWFTSKGQIISKLRLQLLPTFCEGGRLSLLHLEFEGGGEEIRPVPLAVVAADARIDERQVIAVEAASGARVIDAVELTGFRESLYAFMADGGSVEDAQGILVAQAGPLLQRTRRCSGTGLPPQNSSNSVVTYEPDGFLKLFRKTEPGLHPDAELIGYLSAECAFGSVPPFGGALSFRPASGGEPLTLALMLGKVANRGELWDTILEDVGAFAKTYHRGEGQAISPDLLKPLRKGDLPEGFREQLGAHALARIRLAGTRTAEMHLHFSAATDEEIAPHGLDEAYWSSARASLSARLAEEATRADDEMVEVLEGLRTWVEGVTLPDVETGCIRVHGDYHLGQILDTRNDLVIIDFEGEPLHSLAYRRGRHPAFKDVAGMLRSLHYAPYAHAIQRAGGGGEAFAAAADWYGAASRLFLTAYLARVGDQARFLPVDDKQRATVLSFFLVDKALYELAYERASRPDWLEIPRQGIRQVAAMLARLT